ncbi:TetR/AcrR family transcriptional regulator [Phytomonospora endophytica]|uniref:AcrR family transcriptional regulator n=1 Tax=Phytomonospora endophytica TaxID=714109 RepID=A0A841FNW6_9ACTN|nr:TetR/AcrR family transcriptional regulator C-terminal domain-containing protein [Phytomonospora endophytica]MBB6034279.1 AcrR family transcriptional regulator [Phytomonospora endophytica]
MASSGGDHGSAEVKAIAGNDSPTAVGAVWLRPARGRKGEPPLTRARIVEAAVALLDEEGIERLTMRRLGERLDAGATTLYWHVATKDDVVDLAVDAIFDEARVPEPTGGPREDITALLGAWRAALLRHPWSAGLPARRRPLIGPNFLAWMEFLQSALLRTGLSTVDLNAATWALYNHVMGSASTQASLRLSPEEIAAGREYLAAEAGRFPTVAAHDYIADVDWDGAFTAGLDFLLDGIGARARG